MHNQKNYYDWRREAMHRGLTITVEFKVYFWINGHDGAWLCKRHDFFMINNTLKCVLNFSLSFSSW